PPPRSPRFPYTTLFRSPRFHIVWGTGPGIVKPFETRLREQIQKGLVDYLPRHRVDHLEFLNGRIVGVSGSVLEESNVPRGEESSRKVVGDFTYQAQAVVISSGGIGANFDLIREDRQ